MADAADVMTQAFKLSRLYGEKSAEMALTEDEMLAYNAMLNMIKTWSRWNELRHLEDIPELEKKYLKAQDEHNDPDEPDPTITGEEDDEGEHVKT